MNRKHFIQDPKNGLVFIVFLCVFFGLVWYLVPHPAVIVVLSILPLGILYVLYAPFIIVMLFVIFSFFRIHDVIPQLNPIKLPLLLSLGSLFALAWHIGLTQKIKVFMRKEMKIMLAFYGLIVVGIVFATYRGLAIGIFTSVIWKVGLMSFAIIWMIRKEQQFAFVLRSIVIAGLIVGIKAISNKMAGIGLVEETRVTIGREMGSTLGDPNDLSLVLMYPTAFALSLVFQPGIDKLSKLLGLTTAITLSVAVIWGTQSRGGLLGILAVYGIFAYQRIKNKLVFFGAGAAAVAFLYVFAGISDRKSGGANEEGVDESAMGRIHAWEAAIAMGLSNPLTGVGANNFFENYFAYAPPESKQAHVVHSTWFQILAEMGVVGLILFITMVVTVARTAFKTSKTLKSSKMKISPSMIAISEASFIGLIGILVTASFLTFGYTWPIHITCAIILATAQWVDINIHKLNKNNEQNQVRADSKIVNDGSG